MKRWTQGEQKNTLQHLPEESQTPLTCYCLVCSHVFVCGSLFFYLAPFQSLIFSLSLSAFTQLLLQAHAFTHTNTRAPKLRAQTFFSGLCVYYVQVCMSSFPHFSVFQPRLCKNIMPPPHTSSSTITSRHLFYPTCKAEERLNLHTAMHQPKIMTAV